MSKYFCQSALLLIATIFIIASSHLNAQDGSTTGSEPATRANVIKLLKVSGVADFGNLIIQEVIDNHKGVLSSIPQGFWDSVKTQLAGFADTAFVEKIVPVYLNKFTNDEITSLISFYESPTGKKWATQAELVNSTINNTADQFGNQVFKFINEKLINAGYIVVSKPHDDGTTNDKNK